MAPISPDARRTAGSGDPPALTPEEKRTLLDLAWASIRHGLEAEGPLLPDLDGLPESLRVPGASFVTLERGGELRGCIGTYLAHRPLAEDVSRNAFAAAFQDPRFPPLDAREVEGLDLEVSLLGAPAPLEAASEDELLALLEPGRDGLILEDPPFRALFLPQVWRSLPDPREFLAHLKLKAGLHPDHWSDTIRFSRFRVAEIR